MDGDGPRRQEETIRAFCESNKVELRAVFSETISGAVEGLSRPVFCEMLEAIENFRANGENVQGIVVERIDRLARELMVSEILLLECRKKSIKVFAADRGELLDLSENDGDPTRKLLRQITAALAEWEKNNIVLKLRKAREAVKRKTGRCEGRKPYGQTPNEILTLKVVDLMITPEHTRQQAADILNREGCLTRDGNEWNESTVSKLLKRCGKWVRKDPVAYRLKNLGDKRKVGTINIGEIKNGRTI